MKFFVVKVKTTSGRLADFGFYARNLSDAIKLSETLFTKENIMIMAKEADVL